MTVTPLILVVDDDERTQQLIEAALGSSGAQVYSAANGEQGLKLARELKPHLILMDLRLPAPYNNGWDIIAEMKTQPDLAHIPIVAMTASGGDAIMRAMKAGAQDFLEKPFSIEQMRRKVSRIMGLAQS
jgi:CheY-like chemotaxis protein